VRPFGLAALPGARAWRLRAMPSGLSGHAQPSSRAEGNAACESA
jgi:hypothetical protein